MFNYEIHLFRSWGRRKGWRETLPECFRRAGGHSCDAPSTLEEFLSKISSGGYDGVLIDPTVGNSRNIFPDGERIATDILDKHDRTRVYFITAHPSTIIGPQCVQDKRIRFLYKTTTFVQQVLSEFGTQ